MISLCLKYAFLILSYTYMFVNSWWVYDEDDDDGIVFDEDDDGIVFDEYFLWKKG